jgi:tetratricopeptide (TPR) repeat protein
MHASHQFAVLWLAALLLPALGAPLAAEPFRPERDDAVVETLPAADPILGDALRRLSARLAEQPEDLLTAIRLATGYAELGRSRGDPRYDGYAEAALAPWWHLAEPPIPVLVLRATLLQRRHDFEASLADLDRVLARQPSHPQAWLGKATILALRGESDGALAACGQLGGRLDPLIEAGCVASVARNASGAAAAYDMLAARVRESEASDPRITVWTQALLGELATQLDDPSMAEKHFLAALSADRDDPYLLGAYADLLLNRDRPEAARELLEDWEAIDPLLLRLAIAEDRIGHPARDRHVAMLAERFEAARRRGDAVHRREEARFALALLNQPERALGLALANAAVQREPADLRLVLEAALAAGRLEAAKPVLQWLERRGLVDPQIHALRARFPEAS